MLHTFNVSLGKIKKYEYNENDFFTYADRLTHDLSFDYTCMRDDLITSLEKNFDPKNWEISVSERHNKIHDLFHFDGNSGIVHFKNPATNEFFAISHDFYNNDIRLNGRLTEKSCQELDTALKSYGHGLEYTKWTEKLNLSPQYEYYNQLAKKLEEKDLLVSYRHKDNESALTNRDKLIITSKGTPEFSIEVPMESNGRNGNVKKSRYNVIKDIQGMVDFMDPTKDSMIFLMRYGKGNGADYFDYKHPITQDVISRAQKMKKDIQEVLGKKLVADLTPEEKENKKIQLKLS